MARPGPDGRIIHIIWPVECQWPRAILAELYSAGEFNFDLGINAAKGVYDLALEWSGSDWGFEKRLSNPIQTREHVLLFGSWLPFIIGPDYSDFDLVLVHDSAPIGVPLSEAAIMAMQASRVG